MEAPDREGFRSWLVAKEPDEVVGRSGEGATCPGATYLYDALGIRDCYFGNLWASAGAQLLFRHPPWLVAFVQGVDTLWWTSESRFHLPGVLPRLITAKEALTILDSIEDSP